MVLTVAGVVFDLDGTITDSEQYDLSIAAPVLTRHLGRPVTMDELNFLKGKVWKKVFPQWFPGKGMEVYNEIVASYIEKKPESRAYPGVLELLEDLHRSGLKLGIASSRETDHVHHMLREHGIHGLFSSVIGQDDCTMHKPDPQPLLLAAAGMGIPAADCIYIGDQAGDIRAARSAEMHSAAATWGEGDPEALVKEHPDFIFRSPSDAMKAILGA